MAIEHHATIRDRVEGQFHCLRCDTRAHVSYLAAGGSVVREGLLNNREEAQVKAAREAEDDLAVDAQRVLRYLRCPSCHRRNPGALMFVQMLIGICASVGLAGALFLHGDPQQWMPIGAGFIIMIAIAATHARIKRGAAAKFTLADPTRPAEPIVAPAVPVPRGPEHRPSVLG